MSRKPEMEFVVNHMQILYIKSHRNPNSCRYLGSSCTVGINLMHNFGAEEGWVMVILFLFIVLMIFGYIPEAFSGITLLEQR